VGQQNSEMNIDLSGAAHQTRLATPGTDWRALSMKVADESSMAAEYFPVLSGIQIHFRSNKASSGSTLLDPARPIRPLLGLVGCQSLFAVREVGGAFI